MSIHKSKGLEFPVVILAGCGKRFNMQDVSRSILLHQELASAGHCGPRAADFMAFGSQGGNTGKIADGKPFRRDARIIRGNDKGKEKLIMTAAVRMLSHLPPNGPELQFLTGKGLKNMKF